MSNYFIHGDIDGLMAPTLQQQAGTGNLGDSKPVIMSAATLNAMNPAEATSMKAGFDAGNPIVILSDSDNLPKLEQALGIPVGGTATENVVAVAVDKEADGSVWTSTYLDSMTQGQMTQVSKKLAPKPVPAGDHTPELEQAIQPELAQASPSDLTLAATAPAPGPEVGQELTAALVEWLQASGTRNSTPEAQNALESANNSKPNLTDIAQQWVSTFTSTISAFAVPGYTRPSTVNRYQTTFYSYSCFAPAPASGNLPDENWFFVEQVCALNSGAGFYAESDVLQAWYASNYQMNTTVQAFVTDSNDLTLMDSKPDTQQGTTSTTSGISWNLSGTLNFSPAESGSGGSVSSGLTISNSRTVSANNVTIENQSLTGPNNAGWNYKIAGAPLIEGVIDKLGTPCHAAYNNFQPVNQWIWKATDAVKQQGGGYMVARSGLSVSLQCRYLQPIPGLAGSYTEHTLTSPVSATYFFKLKFPPTESSN